MSVTSALPVRTTAENTASAAFPGTLPNPGMTLPWSARRGRSSALFAMLSATGRLLPVVFAPRIIAESESLPAFHGLTEIYLPLVLLAPVNI